MYIDPTGDLAIEISLAKLILIAIGAIVIFTGYILIVNQNTDFSGIGFELEQIGFLLEESFTELFNWARPKSGSREHTRYKGISNEELLKQWNELRQQPKYKKTKDFHDLKETLKDRGLIHSHLNQIFILNTVQVLQQQRGGMRNEEKSFYLVG
mgnify:FL=1